MLLLIAGCGDEPAAEPAVEVSWTVSPAPPQAGPAIFTVTLTDSAGAPVTGAAVELEANMSHPGMAPVLATARETEPGTYFAPLMFTMAGGWYILVNATLPDGRSIGRQIDLPAVQ